MPRRGANLKKSEIWSLLTTINDEVMALSTELAETKKAITGYTAHRTEVEEWQAENMRVFSSKLPLALAQKVDRILEEELPTHTRSSLIAYLLTMFCDNFERDNLS